MGCLIFIIIALGIFLFAGNSLYNTLGQTSGDYFGIILGALCIIVAIILMINHHFKNYQNR